MVAHIASSDKKNQSTPHSNTGSKCQPTLDTTLAAHCDYLVCCGKIQIEELIKALWATFGVNFDFVRGLPGVRGRHYETILKSPQGIELAFSANKENAAKTVYRLSIPGKPLSHIHQHQLAKLGRFLLNSDCRCTRFDWCIDDFSKQLCLDSIARCAKAGNVVGARKWRDIRSTGRNQAEQGRTVYLGAVQSERLIRAYDKEVESNGEIKSFRFETQWRNSYAHEAFTQYFGETDSKVATNTLSRLAVGSVRFIRRHSKVASRCPTVGWWAKFIKRVGGATKMSVRRLHPLISDKIRWIESQVMGTLAVISRVKGFDDTINWLERQIREKAAHLSSMQSCYTFTCFDRLVVERGDFIDWMVIQEWDKI